MPTFRIACIFLLVAGVAAAQDYRVHKDAGFAFGCSDKEQVQQFVATAQSGEESELASRAMQLAVRMSLAAENNCEIYQSGMLLEIVAEDRTDPQWVIVRRKAADSKLLWSFLPWFVAER